MATKLINNFATTLNGAINAAATSITLLSVSGLSVLTSGDKFRLTLAFGGIREIVLCTYAASTNTFTVARAQEGTTAYDWADGSRIEGRITAGSINERFETALTSAAGLGCLDTDVNLTADSDTKIPSQKAVKAYVDGSVDSGVADGDKGDIVVSSTGTVWTIETPASVTVASNDKVLIKDTSASDVTKYVTAQSIADLATGGVSDGNKGDITVSSSGTVWAVNFNSILYENIQDVSASDKLLGRATAGAGDIEEITCTAAGRALLDDADATAQRATLGLGTLATQSGTFSGTSSGTNTGDQNTFTTISVAGQSDVVADTASDTLTLVAGTNITLTTSAGGDSITINATGGGGGSGGGGKDAYTTTNVSASTLTLTASSDYQQFFTGTTLGQVVAMPVTSTLTVGYSWLLVNNATVSIDVQSSGGNSILKLAGGTSVIITCILTSGTDAASWSYSYAANLGGVFYPFRNNTGNVTLNAQSAYIQYYEDSGTANCTMPVAANLVNGQSWCWVNKKSSGTVNIYASDNATLLLALQTGQQAVFTCKDNTGGTGATPWVYVVEYLNGAAAALSSAAVLIAIDGATVGAVTIAANDKVLVRDTSASDATKTVTTQAIRDLTPTVGTTGTGAEVRATSPTFVTPLLGTPTSGDLSNCTNIPPAALIGFRAYRSGSVQSVSTGAYTKVQLNSEVFDTNGWFDNVTNYRFTPLIAGTYVFLCAADILSNTASSPCYVILYKNGVFEAWDQRVPGSAQDTLCNGTFLSVANGTTDYFEMYVLQLTGASKNVQFGLSYTSFAGWRIGA